VQAEHVQNRHARTTMSTFVGGVSFLFNPGGIDCIRSWRRGCTRKAMRVDGGHRHGRRTDTAFDRKACREHTMRELAQRPAIHTEISRNPCWHMNVPQESSPTSRHEISHPNREFEANHRRTIHTDYNDAPSDSK